MSITSVALSDACVLSLKLPNTQHIALSDGGVALSDRLFDCILNVALSDVRFS